MPSTSPKSSPYKTSCETKAKVLSETYPEIFAFALSKHRVEAGSIASLRPASASETRPVVPGGVPVVFGKGDDIDTVWFVVSSTADFWG
jgi:hypothetical protein